MTTNLAHGKSGTAIGPGSKGGLVIGETDAHVFSCPRCARPLSEGTSRCPGCGVRLIMGVILKRAGAILALGIVLGVVAGGATTATAISLSLGESRAAAVVTPSQVPAGASVGAAPSRPVEFPVLAAPPAAVSALGGTAVVNGRIAVDAVSLSSTLVAKDTSSIEIARALRSLAADAALGIDVAGRLGSWRDAAPVMTRLETFYRTMADTARIALQTSFGDNAGYRSAAAEMLKVLAGLGDVDAASRTLATTVNLELPPVTLPGASSNATTTVPSTAP